MKTTLFLTILPIISITFTSCMKQEENELTGLIDYHHRHIKRHEESLEKAKAELEKKKVEIEELAERSAPAFDSIQSKEENLQKSRDLINSFTSVETEIRYKTALLAAYKKAFVPKLTLTDANIGELLLPDGRRFSSVKLLEANPEMIRISHSNGFGVIPFEQLPASLQAKFQQPPAPDTSGFDPIEVILRKPSDLKTEADYRIATQLREEQRNAELARAEEERENQAAQRAADAQARAIERDRAMAEHLAERQADDARREAEAAERDAKAAKRSVITSQISNLQRAISELQSAKSQKLSSMHSGAISPSAADVANVTQAYDQKIAGIRNQISDLQRQMSALY